MHVRLILVTAWILAMTLGACRPEKAEIKEMVSKTSDLIESVDSQQAYIADAKPLPASLAAFGEGKGGSVNGDCDNIKLVKLEQILKVPSNRFPESHLSFDSKRGTLEFKAFYSSMACASFTYEAFCSGDSIIVQRNDDFKSCMKHKRNYGIMGKIEGIMLSPSIFVVKVNHNNAMAPFPVFHRQIP